jgi:hypothetical protein
MNLPMLLQDEIKMNPTVAAKRILDFQNSPIANKLQKSSSVASSLISSPKYKSNSFFRKNRYFALLVMLIKCMLPFSLVERLPFRDFIYKFDPSFICPNRFSLKTYGINHIKGACFL